LETKNMGFIKTAETETSAVLDEQGRVNRVFDRLGKDEASELEILRTARDMGIKTGSLRDHCDVTSGGLKRR
jgi:hypothetical protein